MSRFLITFSLALLSCVITGTAAAKPVSTSRQSAGKTVTRTARKLHYRSPCIGAIVVDAATGDVLFERDADAEAYPASVTKLMTLLLVLEDVKAGRYTFDSQVVATADAYRSEPSWVGIKIGEKMSVRDLCIALMVESANDVAMVLGVYAAGSFEAFVARMNARANELGMKNTRYYNPNGLPPNSSKRYPWKSFNVSTARDQMLLARALVGIPEALLLTSVKTGDLIKTSYGFRISVTRQTNKPACDSLLVAGEKLIKQMRNHNNVMRTEKLKIINPDGSEAVDGLKTGYIDAGGSSVVLTGLRRGKRAIVVVLGSSNSKERDEYARNLMEDALGSLTW